MDGAPLLELNYCNIAELREPSTEPVREQIEVLVARLYVRNIEPLAVIESQGHELTAAVKIGANELSNPVPSLSLALPVILLMILAGAVSVTLSFASAFYIQFFVSPNLRNPLSYNDFLIVPSQKNHPLLRPYSHCIIKSSIGFISPRQFFAALAEISPSKR
jgi:hypothetical protein